MVNLLFVEWFYTLQAIAGILVTLWGAWDGWLDYSASRRARRDWQISADEHSGNIKIALIGIFAAIGGLIGHSLFLSFGVLALLGPKPDPHLSIAMQIYQFVFVTLQSIMLACQIAVQVLRRSLRNQPLPAH